jgi:hypothetical protein
MTAHWTKPLPEERLYVEEQATAHATLSPFKRAAPPPLQGEQLDQYERRLTYEVQKVAPNFKDINLYDAKGDAFKLLKKQVYADARQEAHHPTQIPDGELREVVNYDQAGRPSYTFHGSPSAWMKNFEPDDKRYVKSILDTRTGWQKV